MPVLGKLFSRNHKEAIETRHRDDDDAARGTAGSISEDDLRSFAVGGEVLAAALRGARHRACIVPPRLALAEPLRPEPIRPLPGAGPHPGSGPAVKAFLARLRQVARRCSPTRA